MARSMWSGVISFGLVTIPVKLHTATESHNVAFQQLHEKCDTRIKEQRFCPHCDEVVKWEEIVKGYEYSKGKYIDLTDEDFEKLPLPSKHTIDVSSFVNEQDIDPIYFDSLYYVEVGDKAAVKPYKLLLDVMEKQDVVGVATITFRNKERLCALRPMDKKLCLQTLLYEDEIKANDSALASSGKVSPQEIKMAENLVAALLGKFEPGRFKDSYQNALKKLIKAKLKGVELEGPEPENATNVSDLMEALRASVERAGGGKSALDGRKSSNSSSASQVGKPSGKSKRSAAKEKTKSESKATRSGRSKATASAGKSKSKKKNAA